MKNQRPELDYFLTQKDFESFYWLKSELIKYCQLLGLSTAGSKEDLAQKISARLEGKSIPGNKQKKVKKSMPNKLTRHTLVEEGWKLNPQLRNFFTNIYGKKFKFNQCLRDFFKEPNGRTLADAIVCYENSLVQKKKLISKQFEYNLHIQNYFLENPGARMSDAQRAWWKKRSMRKARD